MTDIYAFLKFDRVSYICEKTKSKLKRYLIYLMVLVVFAFMSSCASSKVKKRSQPKRGPIPCPVKDC